jgi:hypothetical protein
VEAAPPRRSSGEMTRLELLDSTRHKLRLAAYHAQALVNVLAMHPSEDIDDNRRIEMEAHLEGLAYTGTAAAEKTLRSIDPDAMRDQMPIQEMLRVAKAADRPAEEREFGGRFERWWFGERQVAAVARDLRNDAAHRVYEKAPDGPLWRMEISGRTIPLAEFVDRYEAHLRQLAELVERAEHLALTATR